MSEPSIFTRIINGEIPSHQIYSDAKVYAFLTIQPFSEGHTLVVPRHQIDQIWDLPPDEYDYLWQVSKKIAKHLKRTLNADRIGIVVKGFDVPHAHVHLIPIPHGTAVNLDPYPEPPIENNERLAEIAKKIRM